MVHISNTYTPVGERETGKARCGVGELSVFCQSYFNKMLIGQASSIGGKARQEIGVE